MFGQTVPDGWIFDGETQAEAVHRLLYVIEQGSPFVLLTAERGTGKTTVLERVRAECARMSCSTHTVNVSALDTKSLLFHLSGALSISADAGANSNGLMLAIRDEIAGRAVCNHPAVLFLDDLHLAAESLESVIRFLAGINQQTNGGVIVVGTSEPTIPTSLSGLSHLRVNLERLTAEESVSFVEQKLTNCGVDALTPEAVHSVTSFGAGLPGRLMRVCDVISVAVKTHGITTVSAEDVSALTEETLLADVA